jgi:hypothetical protein
MLSESETSDLAMLSQWWPGCFALAQHDMVEFAFNSTQVEQESAGEDAEFHLVCPLTETAGAIYSPPCLIARVRQATASTASSGVNFGEWLRKKAFSR